MFHDLAPERKQIERASLCEIPRRSGPPEILVIVVALPHDGIAIALTRGLVRKVIEVRLTEGAVMKPIISHPSIDHRTFGHRGLKRGMRIDECHHNRETFVRTANHA